MKSLADFMMQHSVTSIKSHALKLEDEILSSAGKYVMVKDMMGNSLKIELSIGLRFIRFMYQRGYEWPYNLLKRWG